MRIHLGRGIEDVCFGMTEHTLRGVIGVSDNIDRDASDLPLHIYNDLRCTFWINEDGKLHWIQCSNSKAVLLDREPIGTEPSSLIETLSDRLDEEVEVEDYGSMQSYSFDKSELEIQVVYGVVETICFGHFWSSNDEPLYPDA